MNLFSGVSWFWRAWRGRSVTFAALFAAGMLGLSLIGWVKHVLAGWGAPWYLLLLLPVVIVTAFARKEEEWLPDPELRVRCARWLILGSIAIVMLSSIFMPRPSAPTKAKTEPQGRARVEQR